MIYLERAIMKKSYIVASDKANMLTLNLNIILCSLRLSHGY